MKKTIAISVTLFLLASLVSHAQSPQQQEAPSPEEIAATTADKLGTTLGLEGWQVFFVDSTLQHNYRAMQDRFDEMKKARVTNYDLYVEIQDEWNERTDSTFRTIMTDEQYAKYLKQGAGKEQKQRAKRREKAVKASTIVNEK